MNLIGDWRNAQTKELGMFRIPPRGSLRNRAARFKRGLQDRLGRLRSLRHSDLMPAAHTLRYLLGFAKVPDRLYLEFVNLCNADCVFCAYQYDTRPKAILSNEHFRKAADEFKRIGGQHVGLSPLLGELFVDRGALARIQYLEIKKFGHIHTYTNASLLHQFGVENVLRSGLTAIHISVPPFDEAAYKAIFRNSNYKRVRSNVRDLLKAFARLPDKTVNRISIEFRSDRSLKECQALPDYVEYVEPYLTEGVSLELVKDFDIWGGAITAANLLPGMTLRDPNVLGPKRTPCMRIFMLQVQADGTIRQCGCRVDPKAERDEMELGHISQMTLQEAYRSRRARLNVWSFVSGNYLELCKNCTWYDAVK